MLWLFVYIVVLILLIYILASEELSIGNMRFTTFDLGGHTQGNIVIILKIFKNSNPDINF